MRRFSNDSLLRINTDSYIYPVAIRSLKPHTLYIAEDRWISRDVNASPVTNLLDLNQALKSNYISRTRSAQVIRTSPSVLIANDTNKHNLSLRFQLLQRYFRGQVISISPALHIDHPKEKKALTLTNFQDVTSLVSVSKEFITGLQSRSVINSSQLVSIFVQSSVLPPDFNLVFILHGCQNLSRERAKKSHWSAQTRPLNSVSKEFTLQSLSPVRLYFSLRAATLIIRVKIKCMYKVRYVCIYERIEFTLNNSLQSSSLKLSTKNFLSR